MGRYCKNYFSLNIETFFKNIQYVVILSHKFLIIRQIKVFHNACSQRFQFMTLKHF